jgi:hypothetical protein
MDKSRTNSGFTGQPVSWLICDQRRPAHEIDWDQPGHSLYDRSHAEL